MNKTIVTAKNLMDIPCGLYHWKEKKRYWKFFEKTVSCGWLEVSLHKGTKDFLWCSHKDTHWPYDGNGPAKCLSVCTSTGQVKFYMESAISMWVKWSVYKQDDSYLEKMQEYMKKIEYFMLEENK